VRRGHVAVRMEVCAPSSCLHTSPLLLQRCLIAPFPVLTIIHSCLLSAAHTITITTSPHPPHTPSLLGGGPLGQLQLLHFYFTFLFQPVYLRLLHIPLSCVQVKDIMIENIEKVLDRGEKLDLLVDKTELLQV